MVQVESVNVVQLLPRWQQNSYSSSLRFKMRCSLNCLSLCFVSMIVVPSNCFLVFNHDFYPNVDKKNVLHSEVPTKFYCFEYLSRFTIWGILCGYYKQSKTKLQYLSIQKTTLNGFICNQYFIILYCIHKLFRFKRAVDGKLMKEQGWPKNDFIVGSWYENKV